MITKDFASWANGLEDGQVSAWRKYYEAQVQGLKLLELQYTGAQRTRIKNRRQDIANQAAFLRGVQMIRKADCKVIEPPVVAEDAFAQLEIG